MWWIVWLIIWILIAFWPARVASRKGHSWPRLLHPQPLLLPAVADHGLRGAGPPGSRILTPTAAHPRRAGLRSCTTRSTIRVTR